MSNSPARLKILVVLWRILLWRKYRISETLKKLEHSAVERFIVALNHAKLRKENGTHDDEKGWSASGGGRITVKAQIQLIRN